MGYTRIIKYGNYTEVYNYQRDINPNVGRRYVSKIKRSRSKARRALRNYKRSDYSIRRARRNFFRLCHANNIEAETISFLTLTFVGSPNYAQCLRYISDFFKRLKYEMDIEGYTQISYIGVPELTKKEAYHFHLLIYNLPPKIVTNERTSRYLQRLWSRGYLDIRLASHVTSGIAGYMAKYMGKFLANSTNEARRAYNCSRNIKKISVKSGNEIYSSIQNDIPNQLAERYSNYEVPYLGTCHFSRYQVL